MEFLIGFAGCRVKVALRHIRLLRMRRLLRHMHDCVHCHPKLLVQWRRKMFSSRGAEKWRRRALLDCYGYCCMKKVGGSGGMFPQEIF